MNKFRKLTMVFLLCNLMLHLYGETYDSIGRKKVGAKWYIIHQVTQGEGLFSVSKQYKIPLAELKESNPQVGDFLRIGQLLMVPSSYTEQVSRKPTEEDSATEYLVKSGETLFSISRETGISIRELIEYNKLKSTEIYIGQVLRIQKPESNVALNKVRIKNVKPIQKVKSTSNTYTLDSTYIKEYGLHKIAEKGLGDLLKSSTLNPIRSEALHHQAKIGTVLLVKNKTNNRSVFVKVVGNCNFEGNKKPIIFLSEKAASIIAMDGITEVEINYAK